MDDFAEYILSETEYSKKLEIAYYLAKKENIFFDNSVVLKTELARMFLKEANIDDIDNNLVITAGLVYACKKKKDATDINNIKNYAQEGAKYLLSLGFNKRFCKVCEEANRYSGSMPRELESDILELVDNFGGLLLDRPERRGFPIDEALTLMEYRNLKGTDNKYIAQFKKFIITYEGVQEIRRIDDVSRKEDFNGRISKLAKLANERGLSTSEMISIISGEESSIDEYLEAIKEKSPVADYKPMLNEFQL